MSHAQKITVFAVIPEETVAPHIRAYAQHRASKRGEPIRYAVHISGYSCQDALDRATLIAAFMRGYDPEDYTREQLQSLIRDGDVLSGWDAEPTYLGFSKDIAGQCCTIVGIGAAFNKMSFGELCFTPHSRPAWLWSEDESPPEPPQRTTPVDEEELAAELAWLRGWFTVNDPDDIPESDATNGAGELPLKRKGYA